jgi:hypothetical protein
MDRIQRRKRAGRRGDLEFGRFGCPARDGNRLAAFADSLELIDQVADFQRTEIVSPPAFLTLTITG